MSFIIADTALRLPCNVGTSAEYWLNLQSDYDLCMAWRERAATICRQVKSNAA